MQAIQLPAIVVTQLIKFHDGTKDDQKNISKDRLDVMKKKTSHKLPLLSYTFDL